MNVERFRSAGDSPERSEKFFQSQDFTDLQVLSQIAWFDEYFLEDPYVAELIRKERNYSLDDQRFVIDKEREIMAQVLPAHADAAQTVPIEISTSPFSIRFCLYCEREYWRSPRPACLCRKTVFVVPEGVPR